MPSVLITGANRGIGREIAQVALQEGWTVYGSVRNGSAPKGVIPLQFDVTDHTAVKLAAKAITELDILINNAGVIGEESQSSLHMDYEGFAKTLEINTMAPLAVAQAFLPALRQGKKPRIVSISSQMAWMGYAKSDCVAYRASKVALNKVMQCLASDLEPEGIRVCVIDPGWVRTDMGGQDADEDAHLVAKGIWDVATTFKRNRSGQFIRWTGETREY